VVGVDLDEVVVVAADFARGAVVGGDVVAGDLGTFRGSRLACSSSAIASSWSSIFRSTSDRSSSPRSCA
jgi:hypothetical protein